MNRGIAFYLHQLWHAHAVELAYSGKVIAQQVHDHEVFGARPQVRGQQRRILVGGDSAFNRLGLHLTPVHGEEALRRGTAHFYAIEDEVRGIGSGIARAQLGVELPLPSAVAE